MGFFEFFLISGTGNPRMRRGKEKEDRSRLVPLASTLVTLFFIFFLFKRPFRKEPPCLNEEPEKGIDHRLSIFTIQKKK